MPARRKGGVVATADLRGEWRDLLARRPAFAGPLAICGAILDVWATWSPGRPVALLWGRAECAALWEAGRPLLAAAPPSIPRDELEALLAPAMEVLAALGPTEATALQRFAEAWDSGDLEPSALLPHPGRIGSPHVESAVGLSAELLGFLGCAGLRPILEAYFGACRPHLTDGLWMRGSCPFCGAPPGFADLIEDGRRRLACHLCGGGWIFSRVRCPFCGTTVTGELVRLQLEEAEEGYSIEACARCGGYVKELDRRVRWNAGSPLVEDWGSPHLDVVAERAGYRRAVPTLIQVARRTRGDTGPVADGTPLSRH